MSSTREDVLRVARGELGTVESPPKTNRQKYGAAYTMNGVAWCAEFVWWVFREAGVPLLIKTAYTPMLAAVYQKAGNWLPNTSSNVQPGDVVLFYWRDEGRIAHVGIVEEVRSDGNVVCIEGNTDARGGRTGGRVMRQVRSRATIHPNGGFAVPDFKGGDWFDMATEADLRKVVREELMAALSKDTLAVEGGVKWTVRGFLLNLKRDTAQLLKSANLPSHSQAIPKKGS